MGWQWHSAALPRWTESLTKKGLQEGQAENIARRIGLAWAGCICHWPVRTAYSAFRVGEHRCSSVRRLRHLSKVPEIRNVGRGSADGDHFLQTLHLH
jgi:hypothetical protein